MKKFLDFLISKFFLINVLTVIVLLIIILWGLMFWLDSYTRHGESVQVPRIIGLYEEEAELILNDLDLKYEIIDSVNLRKMKPGEITEQSPTPDSYVKRNRKIYITVNARSPKMVYIRDYQGESFRKAQSNYRNQGFKADSIQFIPSEYSGELIDVIYNNEIVKKGAKLPEESTLVLLVGKLDTETEVMVPDVYGLTYDDAVKRIREGSLIVGAIYYDENVSSEAERAKFKIYGQEPQYGTVVHGGKRVDLYLSKDINKIYTSKKTVEEDFF